MAANGALKGYCKYSEKIVDFGREDPRMLSDFFPVLRLERPMSQSWFQSIVSEAYDQGLQFSGLYRIDDDGHEECVVVAWWRVLYGSDLDKGAPIAVDHIIYADADATESMRAVLLEHLAWLATEIRHSEDDRIMDTQVCKLVLVDQPLDPFEIDSQSEREPSPDPESHEPKRRRLEAEDQERLRQELMTVKREARKLRAMLEGKTRDSGIEAKRETKEIRDNLKRLASHRIIITRKLEVFRAIKK